LGVSGDFIDEKPLGAVMAEKTGTRVNNSERTTETRAIEYGRLWCTVCARLVNMVTVEQASALAGLSADAVLDRINGRGLHFMRKDSGNFLVCLDSLIRYPRTECPGRLH
jgi:hypothetical protein